MRLVLLPDNCIALYIPGTNPACFVRWGCSLGSLMISTSSPSVSTLDPTSTLLLEITSLISNPEELVVLRAFHIEVSICPLCDTRLGLLLTPASLTSRKSMRNDWGSCRSKPP